MLNLIVALVLICTSLIFLGEWLRYGFPQDTFVSVLVLFSLPSSLGF